MLKVRREREEAEQKVKKAEFKEKMASAEREKKTVIEEKIVSKEHSVRVVKAKALEIIEEKKISELIKRQEKKKHLQFQSEQREIVKK